MRSTEPPWPTEATTREEEHEALDAPLANKLARLSALADRLNSESQDAAEDEPMGQDERARLQEIYDRLAALPVPPEGWQPARGSRSVNVGPHGKLRVEAGTFDVEQTKALMEFIARAPADVATLLGYVRELAWANQRLRQRRRRA
jgi:hypothetical protein